MIGQRTVAGPFLMFAIFAASFPAHAGFVGLPTPESFSVCETPGDSQQRPECKAADVRFEADPAGVTDPADVSFGFTVASGNLNGDRYSDLVVGDPARNRVYVFFGRGSVTAAYELDPESLIREVDAETRADLILTPNPATGFDSFGFSLAIGRERDSTGCGVDESAAPLVIGAPGDPGTTSGISGSVFYIPGGALCTATVDPATTVTTDPATIGQVVRAPIVEENDEFGYSVAFGRLLATTGTDEDLIVGARGAGGGAGRVTVFPVDAGVVGLAPSGVIRFDGEDGDGLGEVLAVGDLDNSFDPDFEVNGDRDDLAIGAVGHENGKVVLINGPLAPTGGVDSDGVYSEADDEVRAMLGEAPGDYFGFSVAISAEGRLAVGAIFADNQPDADALTNVGSDERINCGKAYFWDSGVLFTEELAPNTALNTFVGRRSGDQLGFALTFGDLDAFAGGDFIMTARRQDGSGLTADEIDQGAAYVVLSVNFLATPVDLNLCVASSDCTGVSGINVMVFGGDREGETADELGFAAATGDFNGDGAADVFFSSLAQRRVYGVTFLDSDDDLDTEGRNIRDDDDDGDFDPDSTDCEPLDPTVFTGGPELACNDLDENCNGMDDDTPDADEDGFDACGNDTTAADCDDSDPNSYPGAPELCDGNDNPCAGAVALDERDLDGDFYVQCSGWDDTQADNPDLLGGDDCDNLDSQTFPGVAVNEADPSICYNDADEDGYGDATPTGVVNPGTDCDDDSVTAAFTFPGAAATDSATDCMKDADEDGYGDATPPDGIVAGTDCLDLDPRTFPGAAEQCDGNDNACAGVLPADETDSDGDLFVACSPFDDVQNDNPALFGGGDCDETDSFTFPGSSPNETVPTACMRDADGDDYGDIALRPGVTRGTDCDDDSIVTFPGAAEVEAPLNCMKDLDDDGYGDAMSVLPVATGTDCDDEDPLRFGTAEEIPDDGIDQDCDGTDAVTCFEDLDRDGFGSEIVVIGSDGDCDDPDESAFDTDCDDDDADISPDASEIADDGIDQDCNGFDTISCVVDADGDGFGTDAGTAVLADDASCDAEDGEAESADDCDDTDPLSFPGASELCDGNDNACSGSLAPEELDDDGDGFVECDGWDDSQADQPAISAGGDCDDATATIFPGAGYAEPSPGACVEDGDGDGYGNIAPPANVAAGTDCDDLDPQAFPGSAEIEAPLNCMRDADDDGYGDSSASFPVVAGSDCADDDPLSFLGAAELCDGNDNACAGSLAADEIDVDGDLHVPCLDWVDPQGDDPGIVAGGDCDETSIATFAGAAPNESVPDACMLDADGDDYGDQIVPAGVTRGTDCDDTRDDTFPGAAQVEAPFNCMKDSDDDGWGDPAVSLPIVRGTDCDDAEPASNPGTLEGPEGDSTCGDSIDNDCDTLIDLDDIGCQPSTACPDIDDDGFADCTTDPLCDATGLTCGDCDDASMAINPLATEVCDNQDNNCDAAIDEGFDADGDGFTSCDLPAPDCDDAEPTVNPGSAELCGDALDNDCDPMTPDIFDGDTDGASCDVDCDDTDAGLNLDDADSDTFSSCAGDCDDANPSVNPGSLEACNDGVDNDCSAGTPDIFDGDADGATCDVDCDDTDADLNLDDTDGDSYSSCGGDCDDGDPDVRPGAAELCDGVDNNCNGAVDETFDLDGDTFTTCGGDCDDANPSINPGVPEACNDAVDNDCNAATPDIFDSDADGVTCEVDCDDADPTSFPGATELCDGNDNACAGSVPSDETDQDGDLFVACPGWDDTQGDDTDTLGGDDCDEASAQTYPGAAINETFSAACMRDLDGDGFGESVPPPGVTAGNDCDDASATTFPGAAQIEAPLNCMRDDDDDGYGDASAILPVVAGSDCNDLEPAANPGGVEGPPGDARCVDLIDNDCDSLFDADDPGCQVSSACPDVDDDGYADCTTDPGCDATGLTCGDCDDLQPASNPGMVEVCDDLDNDCNGSIDEGFDQDGDGFTICGGDCDDGAFDVNPGAEEVCNDAIDNDCDPLTEDLFDADLDGATCEADCDDDDAGLNLDDADADTFTTCDGDCDDAEPSVNPGAVEACNDGVDNDCDAATVDLFDNDLDGAACDVDCDDDDAGLNLDDADADTYTTCDGDCDDAQPLANPGAVEVCGDGIDNDCDVGTPDLTDGDADGASCDTDCDDADPNSFPGAAELCDGNDNSCSGSVPADESDGDADGFVTCSGWNDSQADQPLILGGADCDDSSSVTFPGAASAESNSTACMRDADGDDYGELSPPPGVTAGSDCDDTSPDTFPGAAQVEAPLNCMKDADDDGWGDAAVVLPVAGGTDCDDAVAVVNPGASEGPPAEPTCSDSLDNDCDGQVDGADTDCQTLGACPDADADGYADCATDPFCDPSGLVCGDCDDADPTSNPGASELCGDTLDNDCDPVTPDVFDADDDGAACDTDCDDNDPDSYPGAPELCDGNDNACAGSIPPDETDLDGDLYVSCAGWVDTQGDQPEILGGDDCNDADPLTAPGAAPNESFSTACMSDQDGDDFGDLDPPPGVTAGTDCDDFSPSTFPGAAEIEAPLNCMSDADDDGFGDSGAVLPVIAGSDCDDVEPSTYPGAPETCGDGIDSDCDGSDPVCSTADESTRASRLEYRAGRESVRPFGRLRSRGAAARSASAPQSSESSEPDQDELPAPAGAPDRDARCMWVPYPGGETFSVSPDLSGIMEAVRIMWAVHERAAGACSTRVTP